MKHFVIVFSTILLVGCASVQNNKLLGQSDALEGFNRTIFDWNHKVLDHYLLHPIAVAWRDYMPIETRNVLSNFTSNLEEPASMVNSLLQGDPYRSIIHFNRFFLNAIFGMGGLIDVASMANSLLIREESNRFGSTLGHYQIGYGPYIILPGYGSFTFREDAGDLVDTLYPVLLYLMFWMSITKWVIEKIEIRAQLLEYDSLLYSSPDPYIMMYEAYFQYHNFIVNGYSLSHQYNIDNQSIHRYLDEIDEE